MSPTPPAAPCTRPPNSQRLLSLDAYRGLIMLTLAANGFGLAAVADKFRDSPFWQFVHYHFEHSDWLSHLPELGFACSDWDWMGQLLRRWTADQIKIHFGGIPWPFSAASMTFREYLSEGTYGPILQSLCVTLAFWLVCLWLYRQKVFLRV